MGKDKPKKHSSKAGSDGSPFGQQTKVYRFPEIPVKKKYDPFVHQPSYAAFKVFMFFLGSVQGNVENSRKNGQRVLIPLKDAIRLYSLEDEDLTPSQQKYLLESTNRMFEENGWNWFHENKFEFRTEILKGIRKVGEVDCEEWLASYANAVEARNQEKLREEEKLKEQERLEEEARRNVADLIAKDVGIVMAVKHTEYDDYPMLLIGSSADSQSDDLNEYSIIDTGLMERIHNTLATGDVIECRVRTTTDDATELINFWIVERKEPKDKWETRYLRIHHPDGHFDNWGEADAKPGEMDISDADFQLLERGECVFKHECDCMIGNVITVVRLGDTYYFEMEGQIFGTFSSLREAIEWGDLDTFNPAMISIESSEMYSEEIAGMLELQCYVEPGFTFEINGEEWEVSKQGTLRAMNTIDKHLPEHKARVKK